jgi:sulfatase modifying factor 1
MIINSTNYSILEELGRGGMAIVYRAQNDNLNIEVAVKVLKKELVSDEHLRKRFLSEARSLYKMSHTNIIKVTDLIEKNDDVAFVMELMNGETLKDFLERKGKLNNDEIKSLLLQLLDAVQYVHEQKYVHRDIKPSNIMLDSQGKIKLMDFGVARNIDKSNFDDTQTLAGMLVGTPMYMSPEQIHESQSVTAQSDIYSLGVVLWQMVTGVKPYEAETLSDFELKTKINREKLVKTNTIWDAIIQKATEKEIDQRFKSATEFKIAINNNKEKITKPFFNIMAVLSIASLILVLVFKYADYGTNMQSSPLSDSLSIKWVDIPGGTFNMGSPISEVSRSSDELQHQVTIDGFRMSKYEVTFDQYDAFCNATGRVKPDDQGWGRGNRPVINVKWEDAKAFADWVGASLPTEAQWEYACRASNTDPFYSGSCLDSTYANFDGNHIYSACVKQLYRKRTLPVGSLEPNAWGLHDMSGNVWEWCSDFYGQYKNEAQTNPLGADFGSSHVCRGGSWSDPASNCRSACRRTGISSISYGHIGFRVVVPK